MRKYPHIEEMEETLRTHLFDLADAFGTVTNMTRQSIGKSALKDNTFFNRLSAGDGFTVKTFDKIVQWFSDNWPDDASWPSDLPKPPRLKVETAA